MTQTPGVMSFGQSGQHCMRFCSLQCNNLQLATAIPSMSWNPWSLCYGTLPTMVMDLYIVSSSVHFAGIPMNCKAVLQNNMLSCAFLAFFHLLCWLLMCETSCPEVFNQLFELTLVICCAHRSGAASALSTDDAKGAIDITEEDAQPSSLTSCKGTRALGESHKPFAC